MPRVRRAPRFVRSTLACIALGCTLVPSSGILAQQHTLRVVSDDGEPVAFANVTVTGETPRITNERGELMVGAEARPSLVADVRRLGFEPWYGAVAFADTQTTALVTLHRITRRMFTVKITDSSRVVPSFLRGFYERMLARQRGIGNGIYLTPEEVDKRNTNATSALLQGMNGVSLHRLASGKMVAMSADGSCQLTVLVDGHTICPEGGCDRGAAPAAPAAPAGGGRRGMSRTFIPKPAPGDSKFIAVDDAVNENEVAAVEVYPRGASVPPSLPTVDTSCGLVAFWTGGRKAP
jgi:hypothetical protein